MALIKGFCASFRHTETERKHLIIHIYRLCETAAASTCRLFVQELLHF